MMMLSMILLQTSPMFLFHLDELNFLLRGQQSRDLFVGLTNPLVNTRGRFATDRFHVGAGRLNDWFDLRGLLRCEVQTTLQSIEHVIGELSWLRRPHESTTQPGRKQGAGHNACRKNKDGVENSAQPA